MLEAIPSVLLFMACGVPLALAAGQDEVPAPASIGSEAASTCTDLDHEALAARLDELARAHPALARRMDIGTSLGGRSIPALVLAAGDEPLEARNGLLLVGGLDGRRLVDSAVLLETARRLLEQQDGFAEALGKRAVVIVPRVNPDGAEVLLGADGTTREQAGNGRVLDADHDGRVAEDGPRDLDGDGLIAWMRIPDPEGEWVLDEHEPRAMRKARQQRGERGTHRLRLEGLDDDGDGSWHEDDGGGVEPDRNFAHGWKEFESAWGLYPLSEPEARALADFVLTHPRLGVVVVVGADDTLVSLPTKVDQPEARPWGLAGPLAGVVKEDVDTLEELQRRFTKAGGPAKHEVKAEGPVDASFLAWTYHQAGRWPLGLKAWEPPKKLPSEEDEDSDEDDDSNDEAEGDEDDDADEGDDEDDDNGAEDDEDKPSSDATSPVPAAVVAWLEAEHGGAGLLPWTPFEHPELGPVEIGGLAPGALINPPAGEELALNDKLAPFVVELLTVLPAVAFEDLEVTDEGGGIYRVEVALVSTGVLPTASVFGALAHTARPIRVRMVPREGVQRLQGPQQVLVDRLEGAGGRREFRWVVTGKPGDRVWISADADTVPYAEREVVLP